MDTKLKDGKVIAPAKACSEVQEDWFNFNSVVVCACGLYGDVAFCQTHAAGVLVEGF